MSKAALQLNNAKLKNKQVERGGVTGALLDIPRGGRFSGMEAMLRRNDMR
jgi:hypothetical protein